MSKKGAESSMSAQVTATSYSDLLCRKEEINSRLAALGVDNGKKRNNKRQSAQAATTKTDVELVPIQQKTDTHWDFLMKEMMWLAADFQSERKRQTSLGKKVATAMRQFHKTKETRRLRELAEAEVKRRRLGGRIGREVKGWWTKIERVIAYKQRLEADLERQKAMDKQLVELVKQTERYGESLAMQQSDSDASHNSDNGQSNGRRRRRTAIEEALAAANKPVRRTKNILTDYARINERLEGGELYGESTASDTGSDNSFVLESDDDTDDETTMMEEEEREITERRRRRRSRRGILRSGGDEMAFIADPDELRKLKEESGMDINDVVKRLEKEGQEQTSFDIAVGKAHELHSKRVKFATSPHKTSHKDDEDVGRKTRTRSRRNGRARDADEGNEADDDADASDVEDFVIDDDSSRNSDGSEEFHADDNLVDDETTIEAEERLGRDMSVDEEIELLQRESEMSIEELRKHYLSLNDENGASAREVSEHVVRMRETEEDATMDEVTKESAYSGLFGDDDTGDQDEFRPSGSAEVDDETTIEAEERLGREISHEEELSLLQNESQIPIEQLRRMYQGMEETADSSSDVDSLPQSEDGDGRNGELTLAETLEVDDTNDMEFQPDPTAGIDDETTIEAEEKLGRDISYEDEIAALKLENDMSLEELRNMYLGSSQSENSTVDASLSAALDEDDNREEDEFYPEDPADDDEATMIEEEKLGRDISAEDEIALLKRESETPIEDLKQRYLRIEAKNDVPASNGNQSVLTRRLLDSDEPNDDAEENDDGTNVLRALYMMEEKARLTTASRPFLLSSWVKLREYQEVGLNWLVSIQTRRLNGILADEMGLGKTLQTICLLSYLASYKGIWGPHLIIVPTSCIVNWETEFKRFCPGMKVLCYYGSAKRRKELRTGWTKSNWHHVVVTSYQLAVLDSFAFKRKKWYYMVLDEAQNIKNFQSQRWQTLINFNTQRRLLLTGTPLQNNLMELWSLMHFLMPHVFRSRKEFSYWFSNPMNNMIEGNSTRNDELIARLHGIIRPFVLRRLKKDVEKQMPGKFEHLVKCQLSRRQMFLYEEFMARSSTRQSLSKGGNFMGMMNVLMQLRKVCNHPDLFEPRSVITPFVTESITMETASCIVDATKPMAALDRVSPYLLLPVWSGECGQPSVETSGIRDVTRSNRLHALETPTKLIIGSVIDSDIQEPRIVESRNDPSGLSQLLDRLWHEAKQRRENEVSFQTKVNSWRCRSTPFPYPECLVDRCKLRDRPLDRPESEAVLGSQIISTPLALLAMRRSQMERANDLHDIIKKFVFCVPKAGAERPQLATLHHHSQSDIATAQKLSTLMAPLEEIFEPFRHSHARLSSFFPDKKLVQFDAGKLQTLSRLLRELKRRGHRALIFTQMSKMLDILEAFLNLNGHTYLRLDGGTGVERRQRLMDRFNNDEKVFCFILSTRSGGLGINLTGADTVIFYDSDWNPSMDKQAQDRAHRIGQTRDVHIYRLITEHSIEENILIKAQQKRNLDIMVMDEGKFDASALQPRKNDESKKGGDIFTKGGLRDILGVQAAGRTSEARMDGNVTEDIDQAEDGDRSISEDQMERAMTSLEDEDDVLAMRGAQKEVAEELQEFDETIELKKDTESGESQEDDGQDEYDTDRDSKQQETGKDSIQEEKPPEADEEMELQFAAWQDKVGMDASAIEASLAPSERYGLRFREDVDPFWSIFAINEYRRKLEATEAQDDVDPEEIERMKAEGERRAMKEGDLLGTRPRPEDLPRHKHLYVREKARLRSNKKRRKLNGENWEQKVDGRTNHLFWYNVDTGEALWDKPRVLLELEAFDLAVEKQWLALPTKPLVQAMEFLNPFPDRMNCAAVCRQWRAAASDISFVRHVWPSELASQLVGKKEHHNHFRTIADAIKIALPGDTIELGDGHYWVNDPGLTIDFPLRFVGDENDPSHVVIELSGTLRWRGKGGWIEGVTFRRPKISSAGNTTNQVLVVEKGGRLDMIHCVLDNSGSNGDVAIVRGPKSKGYWTDVAVKGGGNKGSGVVVDSDAHLELNQCDVSGNDGSGLSCSKRSKAKLVECVINGNTGAGVCLTEKSKAEVTSCHFADNKGGVLEKGTDCQFSPCSGNTCVSTNNGHKRHIPGVRFVDHIVMTSSSHSLAKTDRDRIDELPELVQSTG